MVRPFHRRMESVHHRVQLEGRGAIDSGPDAADGLGLLKDDHLEAVGKEVGGGRYAGDSGTDDGDPSERV